MDYFLHDSNYGINSRSLVETAEIGWWYSAIPPGVCSPAAGYAT
jgi:hypothetical protein